MSSTPNRLQQPINNGLVASVLTLSLWRWRQQWFLLMMICLGTIAAVTIVCTIPLLSSTMQTAALRNVLRATPEPPASSDRLGIYGTSMDKAASHVMLEQGRLPQPTSTGAEIAVTPETAQLLRLHVGSKLILNWTIYTGPAGHSVSPSHIPIYLQFTMHVVGIFNVQAGDPYWHGYNFLPYTPDSGC